MSGSKVSIAFEQESLQRLARLLEDCPPVIGAHCSDDDDTDDGDDKEEKKCFRGAIALGAHCPDPEPNPNPNPIPDPDDEDEDCEIAQLACLVG